MGKGKAKARPAAAEDDSDDALLRAAIAENAAVREKAALESARAQAEQAAREAECAQRDKAGLVRPTVFGTHSFQSDSAAWAGNEEHP